MKRQKLQVKQPASELPSEVMVLVSAEVELMLRKWHEQEISSSGPHSRST